MYRMALMDLKLWFHRDHRKPLILRGARQVGKSTLVKLLCQMMDVQLLEINLEKNKIKEIDNEQNFSIKKVIEEIEVIANAKVTAQSLIFLDEIQAQPLTVNRLRYFFEDRPDLKVIAAGSLLEVILEKVSFSMPVGRVEQYYLGPMTFTEFLRARGESILLEQLQTLSKEKAPTESLHLKLIDLLKEYYFVGGLPEAVKEFSESHNFDRVREIQISLLNTYREDIPKYTKHKQGERVEEVFEFTPANIGEKVQFSKFSKAHSEQVREAIHLLAKAHLIYPVHNNSCVGMPLRAGLDSQVFKLYFLDIGLYNAKMGLTWRDFLALKPEELMTKGKMAEQFIAQHLFFRDSHQQTSELYYWLRGGKKQSAEVDFIIAQDSKIYPLEVKSGSTGKMRSLWQYVFEKKPELALKFDLASRRDPMSLVKHIVQTQQGPTEIECPLISAPLYAIENLKQYLSIGIG